MKKIFATLIAVLLFISTSYADSLGGATAPPPPANTAQQATTDTGKPIAEQKEKAAIQEQEVDETFAGFIALMPFILFLLLFFLIVRANGGKQLFRDIFADKEAQPIATTERPMLDSRGNHIHVNNQPQTEMVNVYPKSTSRLVMFCSSFSAIFIALSIISASIYGYLMGKGTANFDSVVALVLSLGIGVVPYMTSKLKGGNEGGNPNPAAARSFGGGSTPPPVNYMMRPKDAVTAQEQTAIHGSGTSKQVQPGEQEPPQE